RRRPADPVDRPLARARDAARLRRRAQRRGARSRGRVCRRRRNRQYLAEGQVAVARGPGPADHRALSLLNDPGAVRDEYADESRFAVRAGAWASSSGPNAIDMCREAVAEVRPRCVLEVGPGRGETAEW